MADDNIKIILSADITESTNRIKSDLPLIQRQINKGSPLSLSLSADVSQSVGRIKNTLLKEIKPQLDNVLKLSIDTSGTTKAVSQTVGRSPAKTKELTEEAQQIQKVNLEYSQLMAKLKEINRIELKIAKLDTDKDIAQITELRSQLEKVKEQYKTLYSGVMEDPIAKQLLSQKQLISFESEREKGVNAVNVALARQADVVNKIKQVQSQKADSTQNKEFIESFAKQAREVSGLKIVNDEQFDVAKVKLKALGVELVKLKGLGVSGKQLDQAQVAFDKAKFSVDKYDDEVKQASRTLDELGLKLEKLKKDNSKALLDPNFSKQIQDIEGKISSLTGNIEPGPVKDLVAEFNRLNLSIKSSDASGQSFAHGIESTFKRLGQYVISNVIMTGIRTQISSVISSIDDLDRAMTNLQIVTDWSNAQAKESIMLYNQYARELGVTTQAVMEGADSWLRQGKSIEETNQLIRTSTMFARIAQIDTTESTELLTAALNGYNLQAQDAIKITDMFNAVDLVAATSAAELGKSYQYVAASAGQAGIEQEKLTALLAVGSEQTRLSAESIGTTWKSLIARMQNIKIGKFIDDETGEALNDVAGVLDKVGIKLLDSNGQWRNLGIVIDEVGDKWKTFDSVQQNAVATAMAGTRQANIFRATMESYGDVLEYTKVAQDSAGTTLEKFGVITDSIDYKVNNFKESLVGIWQNVIGSDIIKGFVDLGNIVTTAFGAADGLLAKIVAYPAAFAAIAGVLKTIKGTDLWSNISGFAKGIGKNNNLVFQKYRFLGVA